MNDVHYFVWLAEGALEFVTYAWFVSVPLVVVCLVATIRGIRLGGIENKKRLWMVGPLYAFPVSLLAIGAVFRSSGAGWLVYLIDGLLIVLAVVGGSLAFWLRGLRLAVVSHLLLAGWLSLCSWAVAGMAITDKWL